MTTETSKEIVIDGKRRVFTKVKTKTPVGVKHVYDFEVKDVHNYYANGVNVHNCAYHEMLDDYGKRLGIEFYRFKDQYLRYSHKNIELYPAGPSMRALRGRTRFLTGLDELGWFPLSEEGGKDRERADADEVHKALDRSLLTVRQEVRQLYRKGFNSFIPGIAINISSPADELDKMCRLVNQNRTSTRVLALQLATWEVSPLYTRENEEIVDAFRLDPVAAARDYGAQPPQNAKSFMDTTTAQNAFTSANRAHIEPEERLINEKMRRAGKVVSTSPVQPMPPSVMSLDAGYSNNSFAITIQNLVTTQIGDIKTTRVQVPVVCEIQTRPGVVLHYKGIYKHIMVPLIKAFNVHFVFADRWNSIALLDECADEFSARNLISKQYSVKYNDFLQMRSYVEEKRIILPKIEMEYEQLRQIESYPSYFEGKPVAHLLFQMGSVRDLGNTVIKGGKYTDDLFRALVLGVSRILDPKIQEELLLRAAAKTRGPMLGAVYAGRSEMLANARRPSPGNSKFTVLLGNNNSLAAHQTGLPQARSNIVVRIPRM